MKETYIYKKSLLRILNLNISSSLLKVCLQSKPKSDIFFQKGYFAETLHWLQIEFCLKEITYQCQ